MSIRFGFHRAIKKQEEILFGFPYLVMDNKPEEGKVNKFWFKNGVRELLEFDIKGNKLSWFFDANDDNEFFLINITSNFAEVAPCIDMNLDLSFSNKPLFERIEKIMELDTSKQNYFELVKVEPMQGFPTVRIVHVEVSNIDPMSELKELKEPVGDDPNDTEIKPNQLETLI